LAILFKRVYNIIFLLGQTSNDFETIPPPCDPFEQVDLTPDEVMCNNGNYNYDGKIIFYFTQNGPNLILSPVETLKLKN